MLVGILEAALDSTFMDLPGMCELVKQKEETRRTFQIRPMK